LIFLFGQPTIGVKLYVSDAHLRATGRGVFIAQAVAAVGWVEHQRHHAGLTEVAELHLLHVDVHHIGHALHHQAEVALIEEGGRAVDVVQRGAIGAARAGIAVHLAVVRHQNNEAVVEHGKVGELVKKVVDVLRFAHAGRNLVFHAVVGIDHEDANAFATHQLTGFLEYRVHTEIGFGNDVTHVVAHEVLHPAIQLGTGALGEKRLPLTFSNNLRRWYTSGTFSGLK